jgi:hypothetical protein
MLASMAPPGPASSARVGDYLLDNGIVAAAVANIDDSERSGNLVDLARWRGEGSDDLVALETTVLGSKVRYETLKTGYDKTLGAAYVAVTGRVSKDGWAATVETRYDLASALEAVLVSTRVKVTEAQPVADGATAPSILVDRATTKGALGHLSNAEGPWVATLGDSSGYVLQAGDAELDRDGNGLVFGGTAPAKVGDAFLYSRTLTMMDRPDSLAAAVAFGRTTGAMMGELSVTLKGPGTALSPGDLLITSKDPSPNGSPQEPWVARSVPPCGVPATYSVRVPVGHYSVRFIGDRHRSTEPIDVEVESDLSSSVEAPVENAPSADYKPAKHLPKCPVVIQSTLD